MSPESGGKFCVPPRPSSVALSLAFCRMGNLECKCEGGTIGLKSTDHTNVYVNQCIPDQCLINLGCKREGGTIGLESTDHTKVYVNQ